MRKLPYSNYLAKAVVFLLFLIQVWGNTELCLCWMTDIELELVDCDNMENKEAEEKENKKHKYNNGECTQKKYRLLDESYKASSGSRFTFKILHHPETETPPPELQA